MYRRVLSLHFLVDVECVYSLIYHPRLHQFHTIVSTRKSTQPLIHQLINTSGVRLHRTIVHTPPRECANPTNASSPLRGPLPLFSYRPSAIAQNYRPMFHKCRVYHYQLYKIKHHYNFVLTCLTTSSMASATRFTLPSFNPAIEARPEATMYTPCCFSKRATCSLVNPVNENIPH